MKPRELKDVAIALRELGLSCEDTLDAMKGVAKDSHFVGRLWKESDKSRLIKIGLALIAFPEPAVSDIMGTILLSVGIIQAKIKRSTLHMEDIYKTFNGITVNLETIRKALV